MKPLCEEDKCPSQLSNEIVIDPVVDQFIDEAIKQNPRAHPLCIKRIVSKLLAEPSGRVFAEMCEEYRKRQ